MRFTYQRARGFTLVEMLVIVPMVMLMLGGLVIIIVYVTNNSLRSQARAQLRLDVLTALDRIEQDTRLSMKLSDTTTSPPVIKLSSMATNESPYTLTRQLIKKADCSAAGGTLSPDDAKTYNTEYYITGTVLKRKTYYDLCPNPALNDIWQVNNGEEVLISNASKTTMVIDKIGSATLKITLSVTRRVANENIAYTGVLYVRSMNV